VHNLGPPAITENPDADADFSGIRRLPDHIDLESVSTVEVVAKK
jgi:hypothetical protein